MHKLLFIFFITFSFIARAQFTYISPVPGSLYHNPETNIILKAKDTVDVTSLLPNTVEISGSLSAEHTCNIILSDDQKTILIYPVNPFLEGERVMVEIYNQFRNKNGNIIEGTSFEFKIHPKRTEQQLEEMHEAIRQKNEQDFEPDLEESSTLRTDSCQGLPSFDISMNDSNAFSGDIFYYNYQLSILPNDNWYRTIITPDGSDTIYSDCNDRVGVGWTINHDGHLTCYNAGDSTNCFSVFDSSYNLISNYCAGNGYMADAHEFKIYPGGHGFLTCDDIEFVDLSAYGSSYDSSQVIGMILQELDANHNVVFEWRSWDHFQIDDAVSSISLTTYIVDPVHTNSIELDSDQNIIILSRHMNEITKIDRNTGDIIWRWGGEHNMFTYINDDAFHFGEPHDIRVWPGGNFSMFNNNYQNNQPRANAKSYHLDQTNLTATLIFKYEHPDVNGHTVHPSGLGSVQLLPNGNYFICWGFVDLSVAEFPNFTEVDTAGNIHWEMHFTGPEHYYCYRGFKFNWNPNLPTSNSNLNIQEKPLQIFPNPISDSWILKYISDRNSQVKIKVTDLRGSEVGEEVFHTVTGENSFSPVIHFPSPGIYLVTICDDKVFITRKVFVEQ